ncbi:MAG: SgcJ/EcaC family oxidoreductase [Cyanobium sp.]
MAWGAPAAALETSCAAVEEVQVVGWFEQWNQALGSGDPSQVAKLYGDHALLLPTLSPELRDTRQGITDYFTVFLARNPNGTITHRQIQLGCNEVVDAGTYRFVLHDPEATVDARYTFVYGLEAGGWRIQHHHSSLAPG